MTIAEKMYLNLSPEEAAETLLTEMKGGWHIVYVKTTTDAREWRTWHENTKVLKFKKGGKISFTNGWMNQQYNW